MKCTPNIKQIAVQINVMHTVNVMVNDHLFIPTTDREK